LIEINALTPVDRFLAGPDGMDRKGLDDFVTVFRESNTFPTPEGSRLYTLPFNKSIYVLYYNRAIFNELGLKPPETWDDLRKAARTITTAKGIPGLGFLPSVDIFGHYLYAHGGQYIQGDRAAFGGQAGIADLKFWVDMVHVDRSAQPSTDAQDQFEQGKTGMYIETTSRIGGFRRAKGLSFGVVMLPSGTTRAYQFAGTNLAIFSHSSPEKQKAAWKFIKFLTSPEITTEWAIGTGYLPVRQSAIKSPKYQEYIRANPEYSVGIEALKYATSQPRVAAWESIRGILDDAMFEALSRKYTSEDAIQKAVSLSNDLLAYLQGKR
jgi:multiple sugar transport system substrate-binding protein